MNSKVTNRGLSFRLATLAPGILVAATGVGAGDLLTAALAGSAVGLVILWTAVTGAVLKWFLNEGIARWQMATGTTLLAGWVQHLGRWIQWVFLGYLLIWSVFTGGALVSACGVAAAGLWPLTDDLHTSKIIWGVAHSLVGVVFVLLGGFRFFEKLMSICIAVMFVAVVTTAVMLRPPWSEMFRGLLVPTVPVDGFVWLLGVMGGVGGTVTLLSYGYWIREAGRSGKSGLQACRVDLAVGYTMTAIFGVAMLTIGSRVSLAGSGSALALDLAGQLELGLGKPGKYVFLIGFWGAVFSSLLGVWQSVPYMFADFMALRKESNGLVKRAGKLSDTTHYRGFLIALAVVSLPLLWGRVVWTQKAYAVLGSLFMPLLAITLLIMNNRREWVGGKFCSGWLANGALVSTLAFFAYVAFEKARSVFW